MKKNDIHKSKTAVVIPFYNAADYIAEVVSKLPSFIATIIIVDDLSKESLPEEKIRARMNSDCELIILRNEVNLGVGGATKRGFQYAIDNNFDFVVKIDADDQMDAKYLPAMLSLLISNKAEMAKGNRFRDLHALRKMPLARRAGNLVLSFLTKMATGYWNNFDPTNGFLAIKVGTLKQIDLTKLADRYYFETSLLAQLYFLKARISDVAMPAIYANEKSNMKVWLMPLTFSARLLQTFVKRILKSYFLYDFNIGSLYIITGVPLFVFGIIFGSLKWWQYSSADVAAPTGTIMLVTLSIILGFQLVLQAVQFDIITSPKSKRK